MKTREIYAEMRCIPPVVLRADGRNFKNTLSGLGFEKPYDKTFARAMADTAELFIKKSGLSPLFAYTFSDEISFLFTDLPFDGRVEKIDTVVASFLGSALTIKLRLEEPIAFDSRLVALQKEEIPEYFHWRQLEAWRNFVAAWGYYTLRNKGAGKNEAAKCLRGKKEWEIHEMLFERGINLAALPAWQRRGIIISKEEWEIQGFNPESGKEEKSLRRKITQNWEIPKFKSEEGIPFLEKLINRK
ncbi:MULTISPECIES: tRNA(His) guanylyltransferase Thg1 family protein [unclassified Methanosarcina]|uniref:tRNA(His) guanylyltransferase Thg1 family protein n=1 Tax=unclassified Methanosarcina TaxID=2644672 RepID=UPI0006161F96|nr:MULTISPECIES: tRNA(His) guanylyltransferase Thg1 family protein [unclassified Methanosarcina]AKB19310.1 tRNAHis-5'-guanylyltransferase [Methanosarcina sp. WWM596]AKB22861.1 tRNAHis-5'-guanylyltransferase [Methanosarcina sp. WH1]